MTVQEAIERLEWLTTTRMSTKDIDAIRMAIAALEKEKEPQPEQADKSSTNNYDLNNDSTKLKRCQALVKAAINQMLDFNKLYLSKEQRCAWSMGQTLGQLIYIRDSFEEGNQ